MVCEAGRAGRRVFVALSACTDSTAERAAHAGAETFQAPLGLGAATVATLLHFQDRPIVFVDGDLSAPRSDVIRALAVSAEKGHVGKGLFDVPGRSSCRLREIADRLGVELPDIPSQALTSAYSSYPRGFAATVDLSSVPPLMGGDLVLSLLVDRAGYEVELVSAGPRLHRDRGGDHITNLVDANEHALQQWQARDRRQALCAD